ncbi:unnamed protein product [Prunus armeniaca]|uniref:Uncharacterized protein n=1 Tax=Prunus armeniaca TaxID=36596 RepID=A0A6J5WNS3_PRUAR|nr:unnamed protein product [Prunus armeniaca]
MRSIVQEGAFGRGSLRALFGDRQFRNAGLFASDHRTGQEAVSGRRTAGATRAPHERVRAMLHTDSRSSEASTRGMILLCLWILLSCQ